MLQDTPAAAGPRAPASESVLELGRAEPFEAEPPIEDTHGGDPPPREPPRDDWGRFPRFRGGDGHRLPRWQRLTILAVMLFLSMLTGWWIGTAARVFARGLEAGH